MPGGRRAALRALLLLPALLALSFGLGESLLRCRDRAAALRTHCCCSGAASADGSGCCERVDVKAVAAAPVLRQAQFPPVRAALAALPAIAVVPPTSIVPAVNAGQRPPPPPRPPLALRL